MSPWRRALIGGALGSLFVLLLHPVSRAYYLSFLRLGDSRYLETTDLLIENVRRLPEPKIRDQAAYVFLVAAEAEQRNEKLAVTDYRRLEKLAEFWAAEEPENAFWRQMQSIYLARLKDGQGAVRQWKLAAQALRWDNYQNARLRTLTTDLAAESGGSMAWHWAYAYHRRSQAIARQILRQARSLRDRLGTDARENLEMRYATLLNGVLVRDGARSNVSALVGIEIVELASHPRLLSIDLSQKKLILARQALSNQFRAEGRPDEATKADQGFRDNDAWIALVRPETVPDHVEGLALTALLTASVPGVALGLTLIGVAVGLFGFAVERYPLLQLIFAATVAPVLGLIFGVLIFWATQLVFPSLWVVLCFTFFAFAPEHTRRIEPRDLGPTFRFVLGVLALVFLGLASAFLVGLAAPGIRLMPLLGVPREYASGSTLLIGLAGIVFGLVLLTAPAWGIVQRFAPPRLAGLALREFGTGLAVVSMAVAIISGPIAVGIDKSARDNLSKLAQNEPLYSQNLGQSR